MKITSLLISILLFSCASSPKVVDIDSKPTGAVVFVNGEKKGTTRCPVKIELDSGSENRVLIQIVKPRYKPMFQYWSYEEIPDKKVFTLEAD